MTLVYLVCNNKFTDRLSKKFSNFKGIVTITLDRVIWYTDIMTSNYIPNFI